LDPTNLLKTLKQARVTFTTSVSRHQPQLLSVQSVAKQLPPPSSSALDPEANPKRHALGCPSPWQSTWFRPVHIRLISGSLKIGSPFVEAGVDGSSEVEPLDRIAILLETEVRPDEMLIPSNCACRHRVPVGLYVRLTQRTPYTLNDDKHRYTQDPKDSQASESTKAEAEAAGGEFRRARATGARGAIEIQERLL
jgi:hypothetical protein